MLRGCAPILRTALLSGALVALSSAAAAAGTWAWEPWSVGVSPTDEATGGGVAALGTASALWYNPAGLATLDGLEVSAGYVSWIAETQAICGYAGSGLGGGGWGLGVVYFDRGEVRDLDVGEGVYTDTYEDSDMSVSGGYALSVPGAEWLSLGAAGAWTQLELLGESATFTSFSAGLGVRGFDGLLSLGASITGLGEDVSFGNGGESAGQPTTTGAGIMLRSREGSLGPVSLAGGAEANWMREEDAAFGYGFEIGYSGMVFGRVGYVTQDDGGLRYGLGVRAAQFEIDYALSTRKDLESTQHVLLSYVP